jgi:hypothetical protein
MVCGAYLFSGHAFIVCAVTLVFALEQAMKAQRGSWGITLLFL